MTTIERENIQNPPNGFNVYDIDIESFFYHTGINGIWKIYGQLGVSHF